MARRFSAVPTQRKVVALVTGPPPRLAPLAIAGLVGVSTLLAHGPYVGATVLGPSILAALLGPLWLSRSVWLLSATVLAAATAPFPLGARSGGVMAAVLVCAVAAGVVVSVLSAQVHASHSAVLRHVRAHDDVLRAAQVNEEQLNARLTHLSTYDRLTGLLNREAFLCRLDANLVTDAPIGVVVIALAGFAEVNETLGPDVGDQVLAALGRRLLGAARGSDLVARLGGDLFAVLLPGQSAEQAGPVGTRLRQVFDDPVVVGSHTVPLRSRAGIACSAPRELSSAEIVRRAELTARAASPGGPASAWEADHNHPGGNRLELKADLHRGLLADEFYLLYQPLVSTSSGTITAVEALVRWQHPERGTVPPDEFITLAERSGLIVPLGLKVIELACAQLRKWTSATVGLAPTVAVNVSARQLLEPDFVARVRDVLWGSGVDPRQIVLELTESLLVDDSEGALAVLWQLRALGVRLAIDDFGTGYSSLARLGEMPVDELKIDKSFVDRLGAHPHDSTALVTAAVAMGHGLGLLVVAEGVETAGQTAFLASVGCDLLQGYLLGRPQLAADLTPQLGRRLLAAGLTIPGPRQPSPPSAEVATAAEPGPLFIPGLIPSP